MIALALIALVPFLFSKNKNDLCLPLLSSNDRVIGVCRDKTAAKMLEAGSLLAGKDGRWVSMPCVAHCRQNCLRHVNDCELILEPLAQSKVVNHFHLLKNQVDGSKQPIEHNYS